MRHLSLYSMALFGLFSIQPCFAIDPVDSFIQEQMKKQKIPGLGLLVIQNGNIVKNQGYGTANLETNIPVTPDTVFQFASASKHFAALAILKLIEEGKINSLDDTIDKYLGESIPDSWKKITLRQLLSHTSGLPNFPEDFDTQKNYTEDDLLKSIAKEKMLFKPGEKWMYSNSGYILLGIIIQKASGKFYGDYLQDIAFKSLGMTSTRVNNIAAVIPNRAAGYEMVDDKIQNQTWVSPMLSTTADGSMLTTLNDLAKWNNALDKQKILNKQHYRDWWTPIKLNNGSTYPYGLGWQILKAPNGHRLIEHAGEWQGFRSQISRYPDDKLSIVVLINGNFADPTFISQRVAALYDPSLTMPTYKPIQLDQAILARYAGIYKITLASLEVTVKAGNNQLILAVGNSKTAFLPYNETQFFDPDSAARLTFNVDKDKKVTGFTMHREGLELKFEAAPSKNPEKRSN